MSGDLQSGNSSAKLTVDYKEMKCVSQSEETSIRIKTKEGETITFPESFQYCVVKQEPQDWHENEAKSGHNQIILWEGGHPCETSETVESITNSSESEEWHASVKSDIAGYPNFVESVSSDLGTTKEWSEEALASGVSFQECKIKEEPGDINQSEIPSQIFSQDFYNNGEEGGSNIRGNQCGENFLVQSELSLQNVEPQTERETQTDEWLEEDMEDVKNNSNLYQTERKKVFCHLCKKTFNSRYYLPRHMLVHAGVKSFFCEVCGKGFSEKGNMKEHMCIHTGERPHKCNLCEKRFLRNKDLQRHILTHTGEKPHECDICKKRFREKSKLRKHVLTHTGERPHQCNICEKRFTERSTLQKHRLIHTGEKPHECNLCKKLFREKSALQKHILTHTGEKPHQCNLCEKRFSQRSILRTHMLTHTGEKPHKCKLCEKRFRGSGTLHRHMLTHSGEKPYACTLCKKRYIQSCHLRKHMLTHAKIP